MPGPSVCGNDSMANDVRSALRDPRPLDILNGGPDVSLYVEAFSLVSFKLFVHLVGTNWSPVRSLW